ncbi:hypothetical protein [Mycetocola reblochoni]|uniref:DUF2004 domain-containing protein n=2 Tax=Mycetocola reblochoni TaxID=331618 RepID=A0A1R4JBI2_9MICO|nr:hypothetical protein [Mycetocola reblochoni]RLP70000.1 DUF2004 domain-containing protein [Mycetocola reblochoni]SJN29407.1 hypothetical protein FM119_06565 [Mycetocola reblochoni REB411]
MAAREHDYFGALGAAPRLWSETIEVGEQRVEVVLRTDSAVESSPGALEAAAALIAAAEGLDLRGRNAIVAGMGERGGDVTLFLQAAVDELGDELEDVLVDRSGDVEMDLIRSLLWERLDIGVDSTGEGEPFARLVYGIDSDATDQRIAVSLAVDLATVAIQVLDGIDD